MTIHDIAKMAGVSSAAVSRYLNGGSLSAEKRVRIQTVIAQTGYRPDTAAQTLRTGKVRQIGVVAPSLNSQSVSRVAAGIAEELEAADYLMLLANSDGDEAKELRYLDALERNHTAGIILMGTVWTPALAKAVAACDVPVVVTGQKFPEIPCVCNDDRAAARELAQRMLARGRKKLVYLGGPERDAATGSERLQGVQDALTAAGLDGEHLTWICCNAFTYEEGARCMKELLAVCPELDGVVCVTDMVALGALTVLKAAGRIVGGDVSLAGIGDNWADVVAEPALTTVHFYQDRIGVEAARMLLEMIRESKTETKERPLRQLTLGYTVVERGSI